MRIYDNYRLIDIHLSSKHDARDITHELFRKLGTTMVLNAFMNAYHVADTDFCIENAKAYASAALPEFPYWKFPDGTLSSFAAYEQETVIFTGNVRDLERTVTRIAKSDTWNPEDLKKLCEYAGLSRDWDDSDGETFESVVWKAADKLGVYIGGEHES